MFEIVHRISIADANAHLLAVSSTFRLASGSGPLPSPLTLFMPAWTPGSYLIREYARHVERFSALADGKPGAHKKTRKNAWEIAHTGARVVEVRYQIYANDLTVRTNHVDSTHAYWNGAATYLTPEASPGDGARVIVEITGGWDVATALDRDPKSGAPATFVARTFDELCDSPFECARLIERTFAVHGKTHRMAAWDNPDARAVDWDRLCSDTRTIVETEARLIAGEKPPSEALPYDRYLFLWHVSPRGRGGLEHRSSATLLVKPSSFQTQSGYLDVLSLVAHELFHLWNVKRIRPDGLVPYRYEEENYTRQLWWFEGATSYYDWRTLRLGNLCTPAEYLKHLADEIAHLEDTPGAAVHSLEESSFDAWIKAYRPDDNSLNSTVSYYLKGEVVCALLDIEIRRRTGGRASLDDVVRHLYWEYGAKDRPVPEGGILGVVEHVSGASFADTFASWVSGTDPIDFDDVLSHAGLKLERSTRPDGPPASIGARLKLDAGRVVVDAVPRDGAAHRAGIETRDEIIAVAGRRLPEGRAELPLFGLDAGATVAVVVARDGWIRTIDLVLDPPHRPEAKLVPLSDPSLEARDLYHAWLGAPLGP